MRRICTMLGLSAAAGYACAACGVCVNPRTVWVLYGILCAAFLAGIASILSFSMRGVKNETYIRAFARNLGRLKIAIPAMFACGTALLAIWFWTPANGTLPKDIAMKDCTSVAASVFCFLAAVSCLVNAASLRRLDRDIAARVARELKDAERRQAGRARAHG